MSKVKIQIFNETNVKGEIKLVRTIWVDKNSDKKLTGKKAGQILANNFPKFDNSFTRSGLPKVNNGWQKMRLIKPKEKGNLNYIWEIAIVTEEDSE